VTPKLLPTFLFVANVRGTFQFPSQADAVQQSAAVLLRITQLEWMAASRVRWSFAGA